MLGLEQHAWTWRSGLDFPSHIRQVSSSKKLEDMCFLLFLLLFIIKQDMYELIFIVLVIFIYYYLFVKHLPHDETMPGSDAHYVDAPYNFRFERDKIRVGSNLAWYLPKLPDKFLFVNDRIVESNNCIGKRDGDFVPASGRNVYSYIKRQIPLAGQSKGIPFYDNYSRLDYYFECRNEKEFKLYYCPVGTWFDNHSCVSSSVCQNKPDGYSYSLPGLAKNGYFECEGGEPQTRFCLGHEIFDRLSSSCRAPDDPCEVMANKALVGFDRVSYTICENGASQKRFCNDNEYFNVDERKCVSDVCEGNLTDAHVPIPKTDDVFWKYKYAYIICEKQIPVDKKNCPSASVDGVAEGDFYYRLPQTLVYSNGQCELPNLCVNVFPKDEFVPGYKFQTLMANYDHSPVYDGLYAYKCINDRPIKMTFRPGQFFDGHVQQECKNGKYPLINDANGFYDCVRRTVGRCAGRDEVFDFGKQNCMATDDRFHSFENIPVFKVKGLGNDNWFVKRSKRSIPSRKCKPSQAYDPVYNVCMDSKCRNLPMLHQLPTRRIFVDSEHFCTEEKGDIVSRKYDNPRNMNLDF